MHSGRPIGWSFSGKTMGIGGDRIVAVVVVVSLLNNEESVVFNIPFRVELATWISVKLVGTEPRADRSLSAFGSQYAVSSEVYARSTTGR